MKQLLLGLMALCVLTACEPAPVESDDVKDQVPAEQVDPVAAAQEANVALIRQYFDHFNAYEWEQMADMYAEPALFLDPAEGTAPFSVSHADIIAKYSGVQDEIPDLRDSIVALYPSGTDRVIVEFVSVFTLPDGETYRIPIASVMHIEEGKITQDRTYYDNF